MPKSGFKKVRITKGTIVIDGDTNQVILIYGKPQKRKVKK